MIESQDRGVNLDRIGEPSRIVRGSGFISVVGMDFLHSEAENHSAYQWLSIKCLLSS